MLHHPEIFVFFTAMLPFLELKLAIPVGLELGLSKVSTFFFSVAGSIIPAMIFLALIDPFSKFLRKHSKKMDTFFTKLFNTTQVNHSKKWEKYGPIFLMFFVAIPIPGSGTVGASIIAFIFGVDYWKSVTFITLGASTAAILLIAGFGSIFKVIDIFTY